MLHIRCKIRLKHALVWLAIISIIFYTSQIVLSYLINGRSTKVPILLWWTPLMAPSEELIRCNDKYDCILTKNRNFDEETHVDAILFYGSQLDVHDLPLPKKKLWAVFHEESPRNSPIFLGNNTFPVFDIVSTFSRQSDFPVTLQYLQSLGSIMDNTHFVPLEEKNKLLNSLAPILYLQSDCDTPNNRDSYVQELMSYIKIDSYGACLKTREFPDRLKHIMPGDLYHRELLSFISNYKFVIGFENAICNDYITEKLWRPLIVGSVPIYMGSPTVKDWLPNTKSAIIASDFQDPERLAKFIEKVNRNDSLYNEYVKHKSGVIENEFLKSIVSRGKFGLEFDKDHPIPSFECFVCKAVHTGFVSKRKNVYDCALPENSWRYFWEKGKCESRVFSEAVLSGQSQKLSQC